MCPPGSKFVSSGGVDEKASNATEGMSGRHGTAVMPLWPMYSTASGDGIALYFGAYAGSALQGLLESGGAVACVLYFHKRF